MAPGNISMFFAMLGSTADTVFCVSSLRFWRIPVDFQREGDHGLRGRILRQTLECESLGVFSGPCTQVQGRRPCPHGQGQGFHKWVHSLASVERHLRRLLQASPLFVRPRRTKRPQREVAYLTSCSQDGGFWDSLEYGFVTE